MPKTKVEILIEHVYALGNEGPISNTVMLFNCALVGLRRSPRLTNTVRIDHLWVSPTARGEKVGQRVLSLIMEHADGIGVNLELRPAAFDRDRCKGSPTDLGLREWYRRNGFEDDKHPYMVWTRPRRYRSKPMNPNP